MKIRLKQNYIMLFMAIVLVFAALLSACDNGNQQTKSYLIAYTNSTNDDIEYYSYDMPVSEDSTTEEIVDKLLSQLFDEARADGVHYSPLPSNVALNSKSINDGVVSLDFNEGYDSLSSVQKIILRVSVVLTLVQLDEVEGINFTVNGAPITDSEGKPIGTMNPDQYVNILLSDEELLKQDTSLRIYFADTTNTKLAPVEYKFTLDNQSQSLEEYIVRKIIEGPSTDKVLPTIDPKVELINVMTTEKTCYVNFTAAFLEQNTGVPDDIMIYSIVNSLTELAYIDNVQILVEGDSNIVLHKMVDLSKPLSKRFDLISETDTVIIDSPEE